MMRLFITFILIVVAASHVCADNFRVQGPNGREIILHTNGSWEFAAPLDIPKVTVGERTLQILDARALVVVRLPGIYPTVPKERSETTLPTTLRVQFNVESSHTPTEYDLPESLERVEVIDPANGEILSKGSGFHIGSGANGFVWPAPPPGTFSPVASIEVQRAEGWPQRVTLRIIYKKSYTPPPNETTFEFKDIPVFQ